MRRNTLLVILASILALSRCLELVADYAELCAASRLEAAIRNKPRSDAEDQANLENLAEQRRKHRHGLGQDLFEVVLVAGICAVSLRKPVGSGCSKPVSPCGVKLES